MNFKQSFAMAIKSIKNNKVRSFLTMLGIIIGVSAVVTMVSIVEGQNKKILEEWEQNGKNKIEVSMYNGANQGVVDALEQFCANNKLFLGATPKVQGSVNVRYMKNALKEESVFYGNENFDIINFWTIENGRAITKTDVINRNKVVVLGNRTKEKLFNFENPVGKYVQINGKEFLVVGVYEAKQKIQPGMEEYWSPDNMMAVPYTTQRFIAKTENMTEFAIKAVSSTAAMEGTEQVQKFLAPYFPDSGSYSVYSEEQMKGDMKKATLTMALTTGGIAGISLLVGGIGIMNIMLVSVSERTREIGIRKAIGADRTSIVVQFLIEAATVSAAGGVIGILMGTIGTVIAGFFIVQDLLLPSFGIVLFSFLFSVSLGMFFGIYPANKASKMNPIDALRFE